MDVTTPNGFAFQALAELSVTDDRCTMHVLGRLSRELRDIVPKSSIIEETSTRFWHSEHWCGRHRAGGNSVKGNADGTSKHSSLLCCLYNPKLCRVWRMTRLDLIEDYGRNDIWQPIFGFRGRGEIQVIGDYSYLSICTLGYSSHQLFPRYTWHITGLELWGPGTKIVVPCISPKKGWTTNTMPLLTAAMILSCQLESFLGIGINPWSAHCVAARNSLLVQ